MQKDLSYLKKGSKGEEVKALQAQLRAAGYFKHPTDTGYFGDITEKALKAFQAANGIKADGIKGPVTSNRMAMSDGLQALLNNPVLQGKPILQQLKDAHASGADLSQMIAQVNGAVQQKASGIDIGNGVYVTPEQVKFFEKKYDDETKVFYEQQDQHNRQQVDLSNNNDLTNYYSGINTLNNNFTDAIQNEERAYTRAGVGRNGNRDLGIQRMQDNYNNKFSDATSSLMGRLKDIASNSSYNYGYNPSTNVTQSRMNYTPNMPKTTVTNSDTTAYNPFNYVGRTNAARDQNRKTQVNQGIADTYYNPYSKSI